MSNLVQPDPEKLNALFEIVNGIWKTHYRAPAEKFWADYNPPKEEAEKD